eukprot:gene1599-5952_t
MQMSQLTHGSPRPSGAGRPSMFCESVDGPGQSVRTDEPGQLYAPPSRGGSFTKHGSLKNMRGMSGSMDSQSLGPNFRPSVVHASLQRGGSMTNSAKHLMRGSTGGAQLLGASASGHLD